MIPLIFSEQGAAPSQTSPKALPTGDKALPTGDGEEAVIFGDLVAPPLDEMEEGIVTLVAEVEDSTTESDTFGVTNTVEADLIVPLPEAGLPEAEGDTALALVPELKPSEPRTSAATADTRAVTNGAVAVLAPDVSQKREKAAAQSLSLAIAVPTKDASMPGGATIAQTVLEGRLPQTSFSPTGERLPTLTDAPLADAPKAIAQQNPTPPVASSKLLMAGQNLPPANLRALVMKEGHAATADDPPSRAVPLPPQSAAAPFLANPQPPAVAIAQAAARLQSDLPEKKGQLIEGAPVFTATTTDRPIATSAAQTTTPSGAAPETARHAATQIAVAVTNTTGKVTEIALNPEELGRVRLSLSAVDGAITLNVMAERPETQDLLRRHMDMLAQEFRDLGYSSISFSFDKEGQESQSDVPLGPEHSEVEIDEAIPTPDQVSIRRTTGLDLRI